MKLSFEKINKNLILVAILALLFRIGNFATSYLPKPFEIIFIIVCLLTLIDLIINHKIKEFFFSIPKNIRIALFAMFFSVLFGWLISSLKGIEVSFNMILEFGVFVFSTILFLLILFYTRNDKIYINKYFYALLVPVAYIFFIVFPQQAYLHNLAVGTHFNGLASNPNIISKILFIPIIFFVLKTLFEIKNKIFKFGYFTASILLVSLLFWTSSRGAILSLGAGMIFIWLVYSFNNFKWKNFLYSGIIISSIFLTGFLVTPHEVKDVVASRISNTNIENIKIDNVVINKPIENMPEDKFIKFNSPNELRLQIWYFYFKYLFKNQFGVGPNTHMNFNLIDSNGDYINPGPHNTYLQALFWGGLLCLLSFLYIIFSVFKNLLENLRLNFNLITLALLSILFTFCISISFDDSLSFYWLWIILALGLKYKYESKN